MATPPMTSSKPLSPLPPDRSTDWDEPLPTLNGFYATLEAAWAPIDTPIRHQLPDIFSPPESASQQANALWKIGTGLEQFKANLQHILMAYSPSQLLQWGARAQEAMRTVLNLLETHHSPWDAAGWVVVMGQAFAQHVTRVVCKLKNPSLFSLATIINSVRPLQPDRPRHQPELEPISAFSDDSDDAPESAGLRDSARPLPADTPRPEHEREPISAFSDDTDDSNGSAESVGLSD